MRDDDFVAGLGRLLTRELERVGTLG